MPLATRCTHCETVFRIQPERLTLHGGLARCGHCQQVFDAANSLWSIPIPSWPRPSSRPRPLPRARRRRACFRPQRRKSRPRRVPTAISRRVPGTCGHPGSTGASIPSCTTTPTPLRWCRSRPCSRTKCRPARRASCAARREPPAPRRGDGRPAARQSYLCRCRG
ncbi:MAG: zinc-ribbon domain-containing protein [Burkholderia sp.]